MRKEYDKLVRDKIPEIIRENVRACGIEIMSEEEYHQALLEKVVEEAQELACAAPEELVTELADLYEIIEAMMSAYGIDPKEVLRKKAQRHTDRGGFEKRIRLLWAENRP